MPQCNCTIIMQVCFVEIGCVFHVQIDASMQVTWSSHPCTPRHESRSLWHGVRRSLGLPSRRTYPQLVSVIWCQVESWKHLKTTHKITLSFNIFDSSLISASYKKGGPLPITFSMKTNAALASHHCRFNRKASGSNAVGVNWHRPNYQQNQKRTMRQHGRNLFSLNNIIHINCTSRAHRHMSFFKSSHHS
jgi:hypothetical protein